MTAFVKILSIFILAILLKGCGSGAESDPSDSKNPSSNLPGQPEKEPELNPQSLLIWGDGNYDEAYWQ